MVPFQTIIFDDKGSLGHLSFDNPENIQPIAIEGLVHEGLGELEGFEHLPPLAGFLLQNLLRLFLEPFFKGANLFHQRAERF